MVLLGLVYLSSTDNTKGDVSSDKTSVSDKSEAKCRHSILERQQFNSTNEYTFQRLKNHVCSKNNRIMPGLGVPAGTKCNSCGVHFCPYSMCDCKKQ